VLEAIFEPKCFLKELTRVLKPGGYALFTVPFIWDEHDQPNDFARYSSFALSTYLKNRILLS
jgi:SAM-dependent methyltransferase